jgi:uncharacterized protein
MTAAAVGPVGERERIQELDVLRGIALFGVLATNFLVFVEPGFGLTEAQAAARPTATLDYYAQWAVRWLISGKANTVFAALFGLGFYLQITRGEGRSGFEARYRRRLFWLLIFGLLNMYFLFFGDILHLYAVAGFLLLAMRRWSTRALVTFGVAAALFSNRLLTVLLGLIGVAPPKSDHLFTDAGIAERTAVMASGDYAALFLYWGNMNWVDWIANGAVFAWGVYFLGRFALGAAIGRSGILDDVQRFVPLLRRVAWIAIPAGLLFAALVRVMYRGDLVADENVRTLGRLLQSPSALLLAAGYCAGIVVALQKPAGRKMFGVFAPVGRMALTNYLAHGLAYWLVLHGFGPGLGLAGRIGPFYGLLICMAFFALQTAFSHWWLARFRFGPMEWLWRALTYGERPPFRSVPREAVAGS